MPCKALENLIRPLGFVRLLGAGLTRPLGPYEAAAATPPPLRCLGETLEADPSSPTIEISVTWTCFVRAFVSCDEIKWQLMESAGKRLEFSVPKHLIGGGSGGRGSTDGCG